MLCARPFAIVLGLLAACGQRPPAAVPSSLQPTPNSADWAVDRRELVLARAREAPAAPIVLVGDSITQGLDEVGSQAWARHLAPLGALNLGCTGDRTEHVLWRLQQAPLPRLQPQQIVLLLGTNNLGHGTSTAAETLAGLLEVVRTLRRQCPTAVLHLCELFPRDHQFSPMRGDLLQINQALRAFVQAEREREQGTGQQLVLHAFGDAFVAADGSIPTTLLSDGLHLTAAGYERWAAALADALRR